MLGVYNCNTYHNFREFCKFWQLDAHNCHESPSSPSFDAASAATEARNAGPRGRSLAGTVLCREFRLTANEGANRPVITVFAPAASCQGGICIWNHQLIEYACHRQPNGATVGDPLNLNFTERVQALGWRGKKENPFDLRLGVGTWGLKSARPRRCFTVLLRIASSNRHKRPAFDPQKPANTPNR